MGVSSTSEFYMTYRKFGRISTDNVPYDMIDDSIENIHLKAMEQDLYDKMIKSIRGLGFYENAIIDLYLEHGSIRKASKAVGIPPSSIHTTLKRVKSKIKTCLQ